MQEVHRISGVVKRNKGRGKKLGFPTANIPAPENVVEGVFIAYVYLEIRQLLALAFVGRAETFGESEKQVETHILDFDEDIYGKTIEVQLLRKIRDPKKFTSAEALVTQIQQDERAARQYFFEG